MNAHIHTKKIMTKMELFRRVLPFLALSVLLVQTKASETSSPNILHALRNSPLTSTSDTPLPESPASADEASTMTSMMATQASETVTTPSPFSSKLVRHSNFFVTPFEEGVHLNEEEFWWQAVVAHGDICNNACSPDFLLKTSPLKSRPSHICESVCSCDDSCLILGDCCPDVYARRGYSPPGPGILCSRTSFGSNESLGFFMVTVCPETAHEELKEKCETNDTSHWNLTQPVTDAENFVTFKNRYCFECHRKVSSPSSAFVNPVAKLKFIPWEPLAVIKDLASIRGVENSAQLYDVVLKDTLNEVAYQRPAEIPDSRQCSVGSVVSRCNETGLWQRYDASVEKACLNMTARVVLYDTVYKNVFCYLCNKRVTWLDMLEMQGLKQGSGRPSADKVPLLALLDFCDDDRNKDDEYYDDESMENQVDAEAKCRSDQVYDFNKMSCRSVSCSPGKIAKKRHNLITCRNPVEKSNLYGYKICLLDRMATADTVNSFQSFDPTAVQNYTRQQIILPYGFVYHIPLHTDVERKMDGVLKVYIFSGFLVQPIKRSEIDDMLLRNLSGLLDVFRTSLKTSSLELSPTCTPEHFYSLMPIEGSIIQGNVLLIQNAPVGIVYLPLSNTLICPTVKLTWDEIQYDHETNEIVLRHGDNASSQDASSNRIGVPNFFFADSNTILVCISAYNKAIQGRMKTPRKNPLLKYTHPLYWVALVCTIVSLVFLFISFVLYCLLPSLRNVAGTNNLILIIVLFGGQLFLHIGAEASLGDVMCPAIGVATHFCWLAVMFAQNACSFHMFFTLCFPLVSHVAMAEAARMTWKYTLYIVVTSAAFVIATLAWQFGIDGQSGYGGPTCYLMGSFVRILMFAAPLLGTVVINMVMFIFTIFRLRSLQHVDSTQANRTTLLLYTKLSVFTGLTWLSGFLASLLDSEVMSYLFAVSHGCQGLFVFLAFLANKRVWGMLKNRGMGGRQYGDCRNSGTSWDRQTRCRIIASNTSTLPSVS